MILPSKQVLSLSTTVCRTALLSALLVACSASNDSSDTNARPSEGADGNSNGEVGSAGGGNGSVSTDGAQGGEGTDGATQGPETTPGNVADASLHGQLTIREFFDENGRVVSVAAARFVALQASSSGYEDALLRSLDTCIIVPQPSSTALRDESDPAKSLLPVPDEVILADVSAGENIVLTSPDGTWATLHVSNTDIAPVYLDTASGGRIDGRVPSGLTVDVAADGVFPAFESVAMPDPQPTANGFVPTIGSRVDVTTEYRWPANEAIGSRVRLTIDAGNRLVDCFAADDGLFTVPASMAQTVGSLATLAAVTRESTRVEQRGGATLVLTVATGSP